MQEDLGTRRLLLWELAISLDSVTAHLIYKLLFLLVISNICSYVMYTLYTHAHTQYRHHFNADWPSNSQQFVTDTLISHGMITCMLCC